MCCRVVDLLSLCEVWEILLEWFVAVNAAASSTLNPLLRCPLLHLAPRPLLTPQAPVTAEEAERTRLNYLSPVYKIDEAEHRKLIEEAGQVEGLQQLCSQSAMGMRKSHRLLCVPECVHCVS